MPLPPLLTYAMAFGLLLIFTGVALALILRPKAPTADIVEGAEAAKLDIAEGLSLGQAAMQREDWGTAIKQFDRVLARDLTNAEAKMQKAVAQDNIVHRQLIVSGENAIAKGDKVQAIATLSRIPQSSPYFERAQKLGNRLSEAQHNETHGPRDVRLSGDEQRLLRQRYSNPKTIEALGFYIRGDFDAATAALAKLEKGRGSDANAGSLIKDIHNVRTKQADGSVAAQAADYDKAMAAWDEALKLDLQLVPEQVRSQPRNEIHRLMGDSLYRAGHSQYIRGNYAEAFSFWKKGSERSADNVDILQGLGRLEAFAEGIYAETEKLFESDSARACNRLNEVIALTKDTAPVNAKARAEQARCH
jgi:tetratricopeptide (TPR) repeat protein